MLHLYNSLSKVKELFVPINTQHVKMYVCGPTVYDHIHIGNARPLVVFDTLYRLLNTLYPKVQYVRNITDIDDKIIVRAKENNETIQNLTLRTIASFHEDIKKINILGPTQEPKATEYIQQMQEIIKSLLSTGNAYINHYHVFFAVNSFADYGKLSGFNIEQILNGARVEVSDYKQNPADFVLWKPSTAEEVGWESPWGYGRPGWHIECSAMSASILGKTFDIHGGGKDLIFPHHENEIAQSRCTSHKDTLANYWLHNSFLTINGQKMSKSLGNFITLREALNQHSGNILRLTILRTHYRQPLDYTESALKQSSTILTKLCNIMSEYSHMPSVEYTLDTNNEFYVALCDDLNTPLAISILHKEILSLPHANNKQYLKSQILYQANLLGINLYEQAIKASVSNIEQATVIDLINQRNLYKQQKDFSAADNIRNKLLNMGIILEDTPQGTKWKFSQ